MKLASSLLLLSFCTQPDATAAWVEIRSPNFSLYTDTRESTGRQVLTRLERIRLVFRNLDRNGRGAVLPVRVFVLRAARDFRILRPAESSTGFFQGGSQRDYIVALDAGSRTWRVVSHEYVHAVLNHSSVSLPRWFEEGTAEFYSTLEMEESRLLIGKPISEHLHLLRGAAWIPADVLFSVDRNSPYYNESGKTGVFYAQSWALAHMLNISSRYRGMMPAFAALLDDGLPGEAAFEKAFGRTPADAIEDLRAYLAGGNLPVLAAGAPPDEEVRIGTARDLPEMQSALIRAELMIDTGKKAAAEEIYRHLERQHPGAPEVEAGLGALALSRGNYGEARQRLERAISRGSGDPQSYFEYAMLLRQNGGERSRIDESLRTAIRLNPNFAEAHLVLGTSLSAENRYRDAVPHLREAAAILPRQAKIWHALTLAYHHLGETAAARRAAYRALQAATSEQEVEMAHAALRLVEAKPEPQPAARDPVRTPEGWQPRQGDSRVDGMLVRIDCLDEAARFWVRADRRTLSLYVRKPGEVLLGNLSSMTFEFRCGPQKPRAITVDYTVRADEKLGTDGDVVALEFR